MRIFYWIWFLCLPNRKPMAESLIKPEREKGEGEREGQKLLLYSCIDFRLHKQNKKEGERVIAGSSSTTSSSSVSSFYHYDFFFFFLLLFFFSLFIHTHPCSSCWDTSSTIVGETNNDKIVRLLVLPLICRKGEEGGITIKYK